MVTYDPPGGWMYGFPKPYSPLQGETLKETLLRDGYPQKEIDQWKDRDPPCCFSTYKGEG